MKRSKSNSGTQYGRGYRDGKAGLKHRSSTEEYKRGYKAGEKRK